MERHSYNNNIRRHGNNSQPQHHQQSSQQMNSRRLPSALSNQSQQHSHNITNNQQSNVNSHQNQQNNQITQHDELIKFIKDAWQIVNENAPVFYTDHSRLPEFTPFDLEGFWGQKLIQNIHVNQGHQ